MNPLPLLVLVTWALLGALAAEGFTEHQIDSHAQLRYRVFSPKAAAPSEGYRLIVFLPGGDGSDAFTPWCQSLYQHAVPDGFLAVQLIAPVWHENHARTATWPTRLTPVDGMEEPVEEFFESVVTAVGEAHSVREGEVYTFSWSSGGVPAYLIAAEGRGGVRGSLVAMAVFRPRWLPDDLSKVGGQRFFLYQSPDDEVTPLDSAEAAKTALERSGAKVRLGSYPGGHGWQLGAGHFPDIREGLGWLVQGDD
ncbi:hypothetical protein BH23VER1_BH23VER1_03360 [soil metagenome]